MAIPTVTEPAREAYPIEPTFKSQIDVSEQEKMGILAGRKVTHYTITPQQTILISAIAIGAICTLLGILLSPIAWLASAVAIGIGIYCIYRKDMDDAKVRQRVALEMSTLTPIDLIEKKGQLEFFIDYDLATSQNREERLKKYILLSHLQKSYRAICAIKNTYAKRVRAKVAEISSAPTAQANSLKQAPQNEAQEHLEQADRLRKNLKTSEDSLKKKQKALNALEAESIFAQNLHNYPREDFLNSNFNQNLHEIGVLRKEIQELRETIVQTKREIEQRCILQRKKEDEVANIERRLREALVPLANWEYAANMVINRSFNTAKQKLETLFWQALQSEDNIAPAINEASA